MNPALLNAPTLADTTSDDCFDETLIPSDSNIAGDVKQASGGQQASGVHGAAIKPENRTRSAVHLCYRF